MKPFSFQTRAAALESLASQTFDLIVIGGGITGAGVLRDAALRGLKTLLVEKHDFASGTSSKSSKLVHGGLRYLKQYEFALTRESCHERNLLTRLNPQLVKPVPFVFPVYKGDSDGMLSIRTGMWLYEVLSGFKNHQMHQMLNPAETLAHVPDLNPEGLKGAALYFDAAVDDVRLTLETIKSGIRAGGLALNYAPVVGFLYDTTGDARTLAGVTLQDSESGALFEARGRVVLNATGVWMDSVRNLDVERPGSLKPSKGVHLVVPSGRIRQNATVAFTSVQDRRLMFSIRWDDVILIGTTDTFFDGSVEAPGTSQVDMEYVLAAANHVFPAAHLEPKDVVSSIAGLRPLIAPPGGVANASAVSREHEIFEDPSGLLSIAGGKLTTYRVMAAQLVERALKRLPADVRREVGPCRTDTPLSASQVDVEQLQQRLQRTGLPSSIAEHLVASYGSDAEAVLELCRSTPGGDVPIEQGRGFLRGEVLHAVRFESALHLTDLLTRRLRFSVWVPGQGLLAAEDLSVLLANELGWSDATRQAELARYQETVAKEFRPVSA